MDFPKIGWSIRGGEVKELPEDKEAQARILAEPSIEEAKAKKAKED